MAKELRGLDQDVACDVCGRTILKGERTEAYLAPGGHRKTVCELCIGRANHEGWIRESGHASMPAARRRTEPRRSLLSRLRRPGAAEPGDAPAAPAAQNSGRHSTVERVPSADAGPEEPGEAQEAAEPALPPSPRRRPEAPRHVRAVPTNAEVKVERAVELFNGSEHPRMVAGITRSLGEPWVTARPAEEAPSEVCLVVAWELSWYRFRVDLGDARRPVDLIDKGHELGDLPEELREWNASADEHGHLLPGVGSER